MSSIAPARRLQTFFLVLLACAAACLAVSSQSLWIDEAQTALKAIPPTLHGLWNALYTEHNSNMQMPLYMLYVWGWARLFGVSEVALRAANIPWFFAGFFAIAHFLRRHPGLRGVTLLLYCVHPFVWYYLNEARPYIMQLSGALLVTGALFAALDAADEPLSSSWWWLFAAGLTILCGASLLGVPWAIAVCLLLIRRPGFWSSMPRSGLPALLLFVPVLSLLALYFAWTFQQNINAGYRTMSVASMASVFYDQLGFLGLGPGRAALRPPSLTGSGAISLAPFRAFLLPLSLLGLPLAWGLVVAAGRRFSLPSARWPAIILLAASPTALVFALGYIRHTRMLGRHLTPLFPFILLAQACVLLLFWKNGRPLGRAAAALILTALVVSSIEVRFAFRHSKDDYRSATTAAAQALAQGRIVWWAADSSAATYYHLPPDVRGLPGSVRWLGGEVPAGITTTSTTRPDLIFLSKPDLFDPAGAIAAFIASGHYHPAATWQNFTLWEKPPAP
jgi:hypothetical protein